MKKYLGLLLICIIVIIIIIILLVMNLIMNNSQVVNNTIKPVNNILEQNIIQNNTTTKKIAFKNLENKKYYLIIEDCIYNILEEMRLANSEELIKEKYEITNPEEIKLKKQEINVSYENKISKKFKEEIKLEDINNSDILKDVIMQDSYTIKNIYQQTGASSIKVFLVYGEFPESKTNYSFIVALNTENYTYEIYLDEYLKKYNYIESEIENLDIKINTVANNKYNKVQKNYTNTEATETILKRYLINTRVKLSNNPEQLYELLDEEYKKAKFPTKEQFVNFAKTFSLSQLKEYKIDSQNKYNLIICRDNWENCVIFKETAVMKYSIILDPYTIDIESITSEYQSDYNKKVKLNTQKLIQMLNMKDYAEIYKRLNETFKQNNFPDLAKFENYIKENFYDINKLEIVRIENKDSYYLARVRIINAKKETQRQLVNIIMKPGKNIDFEMSFNIE